MLKKRKCQGLSIPSGTSLLLFFSRKMTRHCDNELYKILRVIFKIVAVRLAKQNAYPII